MRSSIIYRYIFRELVLTFLLSIAFLNSILTINSLFSLSKKFLDFGVSLIDLSMLVILLQPQLMLFTIPIALLLSILITYGRLNVDNELIILRANGMSLIRIARPVFTLGVICFIFGLFISLYLGPFSASNLRKGITEIISTRLPMAIKEGVFNTTFRDIVIMPHGKTSSNTFDGIFIYDGRNKKEPAFIWASHATIASQGGIGSIYINLKNGTLYVTGEDSITEMRFNRYMLYLNLDLPEPAKSINELSFRELLQQFRESRALSVNLEFHRRLSLPVVSLIIMFLGPPLFPIAGKTGRLGGLSIGLFTCTIYYLLSIYFNNLVRAGKLNQFIGGWGPTVLLGICALLAFYRMSKR